MRQNYVIVNGKPSWEIDGLIILSYPPVIRAPMRIEEEQVDGRHGSIITELGYDPYDRELPIGLVGEYDINRVITYFGMGGEMIFGNEPDKIYNAAIIEQISFEKLVRNRKATVTLHCQPFKYQASEPVTSLTASPGSFINSGNVTSAPTYHITGTGTVVLTVSGGSLTIVMPDSGEIFIDTEELDAYDGTGALMNNKCTGSYAALRASPGRNSVSWTGDLHTIEITEKSRWV